MSADHKHVTITFRGSVSDLATDIRAALSSEERVRLRAELGALDPVPMLLTCPSCGARHIDEGEFATKPHHTHACQSCGMCWRPAIVPTCGVQFLPGFKSGGSDAR